MRNVLATRQSGALVVTNGRDSKSYTVRVSYRRDLPFPSLCPYSLRVQRKDICNNWLLHWVSVRGCLRTSNSVRETDSTQRMWPYCTRARCSGGGGGRNYLKMDWPCRSRYWPTWGRAQSKVTKWWNHSDDETNRTMLRLEGGNIMLTFYMVGLEGKCTAGCVFLYNLSIRWAGPSGKR